MFIAAFLDWDKHVARCNLCIWESPLQEQSVFFALVNSIKHAWSSTARPGASEETKNLHFRRFASPLFSKMWTVLCTECKPVAKIRIELIDSPQQHHFKLDNLPVAYFQCTSVIYLKKEANYLSTQSMTWGKTLRLGSVPQLMSSVVIQVFVSKTCQWIWSTARFGKRLYLRSPAAEVKWRRCLFCFCCCCCCCCCCCRVCFLTFLFFSPFRLCYAVSSTDQ